jgi:hypothetical protein
LGRRLIDGRPPRAAAACGHQLLESGIVIGKLLPKP